MVTPDKVKAELRQNNDEPCTDIMIQEWIDEVEAEIGQEMPTLSGAILDSLVKIKVLIKCYHKLGYSTQDLVVEQTKTKASADEFVKMTRLKNQETETNIETTSEVVTFGKLGNAWD